MSAQIESNCDEREEGMISDDEEENGNAKDGNGFGSSSGAQSIRDDYRNSQKHSHSPGKDSKHVSKKHLVEKHGSGDEEVEEGQIPASPYRNNENSKSTSYRSKSRSRSPSRSRSKDSSKNSRSGSESKSVSRSRSRSRSRNRRKRQFSRSRSRSRSRRHRSGSRSRSRSGSRSPYSGPIIKDYRRGRRGNFPTFNRFIRGRRPFRRGSFVPHHNYRNKYRSYSRSRSKSGSPKRRMFHEREKESRSPEIQGEKSEVLNPADIKKSQKQITQSFLAMLEEKQKKSRMVPIDYPKFEKSHTYNARQHGFVNTFATVGGSSESPNHTLSFELEKDGWQVIDDAETDSTRKQAEEEGKEKFNRQSEEMETLADHSRKRRESMSISGDSETDDSANLKSMAKPNKKSHSSESSSEEEPPKHSRKDKEKEKDSKKRSKHKKKEKRKKKRRDESYSSSDEEEKGKRRKSKKKKKHSKKYDDDSESEDEDEGRDEVEKGAARSKESEEVTPEKGDENTKKDKSKKKKKRSRSESSSESDSEEERSRKKRSKRKRKKKRTKKRRRDSSSSSSSDDDSDDSSDSEEKKKKSKKRKKKRKSKKTKKSKKESSEKTKKKSSSKKKSKPDEKTVDNKENVSTKKNDDDFIWPTAMICYTSAKPSLQYCVNPKYMCESKVEHSVEKSGAAHENNSGSLASEYERFLNEVNPNAASEETITLENQLREKLLAQIHHKPESSEGSTSKEDFISPSERRNIERAKKQQQKELEKEESLKRQESLKSAPLNAYYSSKKTASDTVVDMETSNSPKDNENSKEPFLKSGKEEITISFSDGKAKKDSEKKVDVEDEKKLTAKELLDKVKKKKETEKGDAPKVGGLRRFGNLPVIGKRPTKKKPDNGQLTTEQLIYNMNADYNYYVHYYMTAYGLDAYSAAYYAQYVMLTNGEYAYADTTLWMQHQGYVLTDATAMQQQQQPQAAQAEAPVGTSAVTNMEETNKTEENGVENNADENKSEESKVIDSESKDEITEVEMICENNALTGNNSSLPKSIEVVIPNTPLSATEMFVNSEDSKNDDLSRFRLNSKANGEDSGVGESPSPPPIPPPPMRPEITSFVTTSTITLPNGEQLPPGTTQIIVHPYPHTHPLADKFTAEEFSNAFESSRKKSDFDVHRRVDAGDI